MEKAFPIAGSEKTNVSISFCKPLKRLSMRSNLVILNTLNILAICGRRERVAFFEPLPIPE